MPLYALSLESRMMKSFIIYFFFIKLTGILIIDKLYETLRVCICGRRIILL